MSKYVPWDLKNNICKHHQQKEHSLFIHLPGLAEPPEGRVVRDGVPDSSRWLETLNCDIFKGNDWYLMMLWDGLD